MKRYIPIVFSAIFLLNAFLPCRAPAASITQRTAAIGEGCTASGGFSTAMGYGSTASGSCSTAMGYKSTASSSYSTAMGFKSTASGYSSTAMGFNGTASKSHSTAIGYRITASNIGSTVFGYSSVPDSVLINNIAWSFMVGYMTSSSDTKPEFFVKDGGVGINTTAPSTSFHVKKDISGPASLANHVAAIENTASGSSPDVLMLKVNIADPDEFTNFITFSDSTNNLGSIEGNGSGGIALNTSGGDFAEYLKKADPQETLNPGDIVGLFPEGLRRNTRNAQRIMVVTTAPAVLGSRPRKKDLSLYAPVAFLGRVPVNIEGSVCSGDYIVPNGRANGMGMAVPGNKIKPAQYGSIVGRSLESNFEKGTKTATVLVGLPRNRIWDDLLNEKDARICALEERLSALEANSDNSATAGLLPGAGIIMGSLGLFWIDRRRKRP